MILYYKQPEGIEMKCFEVHEQVDATTPFVNKSPSDRVRRLKRVGGNGGN